jgi:hypothetical protein
MAPKRSPDTPPAAGHGPDDADGATPSMSAASARVQAALGLSATDADGVVPKVRRAVHDLRQPVQAMRLFVHLLSTRLERDEDRALVGKLDEALENIELALRALMASVVTPASATAPAEGRDDDPADGQEASKAIDPTAAT